MSVSKPEHKHTDITAAEYVARLKTDKSVHEVAELSASSWHLTR